LFEKKLSIDETEKITQIDKGVIEKIHQLHINSEHKRLPSQKPDRD
jgi:NAD+ synthase